MPVLSGSDEGLYHLGSNEVPVELVQLVQPKLVAGVVRVLRIVWVAAQVTEELHQHERASELLLLPQYALSNVAYLHPRAAGGWRLAIHPCEHHLHSSDSVEPRS